MLVSDMRSSNTLPFSSYLGSKTLSRKISSFVLYWIHCIRSLFQPFFISFSKIQMTSMAPLREELYIASLLDVPKKCPSWNHHLHEWRRIRTNAFELQRVPCIGTTEGESVASSRMFHTRKNRSAPFPKSSGENHMVLGFSSCGLHPSSVNTI